MEEWNDDSGYFAWTYSNTLDSLDDGYIFDEEYTANADDWIDTWLYIKNLPED